MEISSFRGLSELGIMEDPTFLHHWHLSSNDTPNLLPTVAAFGETLQKHPISKLNPKTSIETLPAGIERPTKQLKNTIWIQNKSSHHQTSDAQFVPVSNLLSFVDSNYNTSELELVRPKVEMVCPKMDTTTPSGMLISEGNFGNENYVVKACQEAKKIGTRSPKPYQPHDHIIAERKRREKLSQRFIALSALVPGLKKMDKASVLGDAIKYLKQMQEKVSALEEEQRRKRTVESVVIVKKSQLSNDAEDSCSDTGEPSDEALPEIEVRFCERNVLIRVHCVKNTEVIEKIISEIEKLHLKVTNSSAMTFGSAALDITTIALMDKEFCMTVKDLVRNLRSAFASFM